jgi:hypothetical protein
MQSLGIQTIGQQLLAEVRKHQQLQINNRLRNEGQMEFDFVKELDKQANEPMFKFDDYTDDKVTGLMLFQNA